MRCFWGLCAFLSCSVLPQALAQPVCSPGSIDAPKFAIGDWWIKKHPSGAEEKSEVKAITRGDVLVAVSTGADQKYNLHWGVIDGLSSNDNPVSFRPALPMAVFPLKEGVKWDETISFSVRGGTSQAFQFGGHVTGFEKIKVDAGEFCAARVEFFSRSFKAATCYYIHDTALNFGMYAKCEGSTTRSIRNFELKSFGRR